MSLNDVVGHPQLRSQGVLAPSAAQPDRQHREARLTISAKKDRLAARYIFDARPAQSRRLAKEASKSDSGSVRQMIDKPRNPQHQWAASSELLTV